MSFLAMQYAYAAAIGEDQGKAKRIAAGLAVVSSTG
jgi:hypothetical protein